MAELSSQEKHRISHRGIDLLREVGFSQVEVLHKNGCFAAFGAFKTANDG